MSIHYSYECPYSLVYNGLDNFKTVSRDRIMCTGIKVEDQVFEVEVDKIVEDVDAVPFISIEKFILNDI